MINMAKILMMSAKIATPALLKIKVFWNKNYYVIYSVYGVTNKILSHDSNYIVDVVMWPKLGNSSICIREVSIKFYTSLSKGLKLKVREIWGLIPTFVEVTGEKLVGRPFCLLPSWMGLNTGFKSTDVHLTWSMF